MALDLDADLDADWVIDLDARDGDDSLLPRLPYPVTARSLPYARDDKVPFLVWLGVVVGGLLAGFAGMWSIMLLWERVRDALAR